MDQQGRCETEQGQMPSAAPGTEKPLKWHWLRHWGWDKPWGKLGFAGHWAKPCVANSFGLKKSMARWQRQLLSPSPQHSLDHTCSIVHTIGRSWGTEVAAAWKRGHLSIAQQCLWGSHQGCGDRLWTAQSDDKMWDNLKKLKWGVQAAYEEELFPCKGSPAVRHAD